MTNQLAIHILQALGLPALPSPHPPSADATPTVATTPTARVSLAFAAEDCPLARAVSSCSVGALTNRCAEAFRTVTSALDVLRTACIKHEAHRRQLLVREDCNLLAHLRSAIHQVRWLHAVFCEYQLSRGFAQVRCLLHVAYRARSPLPALLADAASASLRAATALARTMTLDDDVRVHAGQAHEHSRWLVEAGLVKFLVCDLDWRMH